MNKSVFIASRTYFFEKNYNFIKKSNLSEKNVKVEEELDCIDIDEIRNRGFI